MKPYQPQPTIDLLLRENKILRITLYIVAVLSVLCGIVLLGFWTVAEPAHSCIGRGSRDVPVRAGLALRPSTAT